jgi:hypothetical protein
MDELTALQFFRDIKSLVFGNAILDITDTSKDEI